MDKLILASSFYGDIKGLRFEYLHQWVLKQFEKKIMSYDEISQEEVLKLFKTSDFNLLVNNLRQYLPSSKLDEGLDILDSRLRKPGCFSDDTVLTIATMSALIQNNIHPSFRRNYFEWAKRYPNCGYGGQFNKHFLSKNTWDEVAPYNSFGNGSAMRVSPIAFVSKNLEDLYQKAIQSAGVSHNNPEGIRGALAVAEACFAAKNWANKGFLRDEIQKKFFYDLTGSYTEIQEKTKFDATCQGSVPGAMIAFFSSADQLSAVNRAIAPGGDADTQACIAGAMADYFYPKNNPCMEEINKVVVETLPAVMIEVIVKFEKLLDNI